MPILLIWLGVNVIALIILFHNLMKSDGWWDLLFYPKLHEYLSEEEVDGAAVIFMDVLVSVLLAPALVVYFVSLTAMMILTLILIGLLELGKKFKK